MPHSSPGYPVFSCAVNCRLPWERFPNGKTGRQHAEGPWEMTMTRLRTFWENLQKTHAFWHFFLQVESWFHNLQRSQIHLEHTPIFHFQWSKPDFQQKWFKNLVFCRKWKMNVPFLKEIHYRIITHSHFLFCSVYNECSQSHYFWPSVSSKTLFPTKCEIILKCFSTKNSLTNPRCGSRITSADLYLDLDSAPWVPSVSPENPLVRESGFVVGKRGSNLKKLRENRQTFPDLPIWPSHKTFGLNGLCKNFSHELFENYRC